jgi:cytochrome c-550 PedF
MFSREEERMTKRVAGTAMLALTVSAVLIWNPAHVSAHGDVTPQPVDTTGLPELGEEWLEENPWRDPSKPEWKIAVEKGASGYNQNCARCHGLEAVSGGTAPDLRFLEANPDGDAWYVERFTLGYTQGGITKMPAFDELLGQKAGWAIRTYIETRPDEGALDEYQAELQDAKKKLADFLAAGKTAPDVEADLTALKTRLADISGKVKTGSGAPLADSVASRTESALNGSPESLKKAEEILTIGLSAAK